MIRLSFFVAIWLACVSTVHSTCPSRLITTSDIQVAWRASRFAYLSGSVTGALIPGTKFRIIAHAEDEVIEERTPVKVFVAEYGKTTIIAYRGSLTFSQIADQLATIVRHMGGEKVTIDGVQATIVKYFWRGYEQLFDNVKPYLGRQDHKYIITGHSLGGSMASILSVMAVEQGHSVWKHPASSLITFGQPRTGDRVYATKHDKLINGFRKLRFTNRNDPFPQLPLPLVPSAVHHSREVWMAKQITWWSPRVYWKVCDEGDAWWGSFQRFLAPNFNDHMPDKYERYVLKLPSLYIDDDSGKHNSFSDALFKTCN